MAKVYLYMRVNNVRNNLTEKDPLLSSSQYRCLITFLLLFLSVSLFCGPVTANCIQVMSAQGLSDVLNATGIGDASYVDADGKVVLYKNITLPLSIIISTFGEELVLTTTPDASHVIYRGDSDQLFQISDNSTFILEGSGENFIILDGNSSFYPDGASPLIYETAGTLELRTGSLLRNNHAQYGGGVLVAGSNLTISGGIIQDNVASSNGGGVYSSTAGNHIQFSSGSISGNIANDGGGVYLQAGELNVSSGSISGNTATNNGGGVYLQMGTLSLSSGTISRNTATNNGGGVYLQTGNFSLSSGTISENSAGMIGGGVYIDITSSYPCTVNISGGTIDQNRADYVGNDVYYPGNNQKFLYLSGEAQVNDLYLRSGIINISQPFTETGGINHLFIGSARAGHTFAHLDYYSSPSDIFDLTAIQLNSTQESAWSINQSAADLYLLKNISALYINYRSNLPYTGNEQVLRVSLRDAGYLLTAGHDYIISGNTGTLIGDYYCTIQGIGNYSGTSAPAWSIERAAPTESDLNFSLASSTYDGSAHPVSVTPNDTVLGLGSLTVYYNNSSAAPVSAGDYPISVEIEEGANYTSANFDLGDFVIGKAAPTVNDLSYSLTSSTYDGSAHNVSVTAKDSVLGLGSMTVLYNNSSAAPVSAGDYAISVRIAEGVNYTSADVDLGTFVISPIYVPPSDDDDDDDEDYAYPTQTSSSTYIVNTSSTPTVTPTTNLNSSPASTPPVKATFIPTPAASESNASFPSIGIIGGIVLAILVVIGGGILFIRRKV
ncbi:MAG: MBG domain-containing protein [Methanocorpusculum sp.]|nr:MBG domain-containing protein [Methanocorpusculum sp.]